MTCIDRSMKLIVVGIFTLGLVFSVEAVAAKLSPPSKPIVISGCKKKKPEVKFDHPAHVKGMHKEKMTCNACHHKVKGKEAEKPKCSACHMQKRSAKIGTCQDMSLKKNPFHILCVGCHKKMKAQHPKAATACAKCHKK